MQCQDCDAKDQVTIAGKTFCANCGTPTLIQNPSTTGSSQTAPATNPGAVQPDPQQVISSNSLNENDLADELTNSLRKQSPIVFGPQPQQTPKDINTVPAPSSSSLNSINNQLWADKTAQASTQPNQAETITPQPDSALKPSNLPNNEQNSEFTSLDNKEESVFSDSQLKELASMPNPIEQTSQNSANNTIAPSLSTPQQTVQPPQNSAVLNTNVTPKQPSSPAQVKPMQDITSSGGQSPQPNTSVDTRPSKQKVTGQYLGAQANSITSATSTASYLSKPSPQPSANTTAATPPTSNVAPSAVKTDTTPSASTFTSNVAQVSKKDKVKSIGGKAASVGLTLTGLVLLGVYVWQINYPNLALKVASSKAGINASLPAYVPSGWKVSGDIQANPGGVVYDIKSPDGAKTISVNEERTDWDSQALAENYLSTKTKKYTTLQSEGLTIYIYGNNQASWINHGTWYRIEGNHGLTQEQIIKMATSL